MARRRRRSKEDVERDLQEIEMKKFRNYAVIASSVIVAVLVVTAVFLYLPGNETSGGSGMETSANRIAVINTNKGTFKFVLHEDKVPITTGNFIKLAQQGFYDGLTFHRYEPGFVIQGGDPNGDGTGGSDETIPLEIDPDLTHVMGAVGMARSQDPDSASSQFYVCLDDAHQLDGNYAVFGQVTEGMSVVLALGVGDFMNSVTIISG